eukprot:3899852-Prymnesium_polylepis.3
MAPVRVSAEYCDSEILSVGRSSSSIEAPCTRKAQQHAPHTTPAPSLELGREQEAATGWRRVQHVRSAGGGGRSACRDHELRHRRPRVDGERAAGR